MTVKESLILYFLLLKVAPTITLSFLDVITNTQQVVSTDSQVSISEQLVSKMSALYQGGGREGGNMHSSEEFI